MDITKIFNPTYLFDPNPGISFEYFPHFTILFGLLTLTGIVLYFHLRFICSVDLLKRSLRPLPGKLFTYGLVGFVFLFFRSQGAPYLSMRIWLILYTLLAFYLTYLAIHSVKNDYQTRKYFSTKRKDTKEDPYLPTAKKRKRK